MQTSTRAALGACVTVAWCCYCSTLGAFPRGGATQTASADIISPTRILENARVTVWEVVSEAARAVRPEPNRFDTCNIALTGGSVRVVGLDGNVTSVTRPIGDVMFDRRGAGRVYVPPNGLAKSIVVELKDARVPALVNTSGYPNAFPRPGSIKVLENDRLIAWDYTWTAGTPTPVHFHDKDVVVVYLGTGELLSTSPDGQQVNNPHYFGFTKFNPRDRTHTETLVKGKGRAIIVELR